MFVAEYYVDLVGAIIDRPLRPNVTNSPKSNANTKLLSARALDERPYIICGTLLDKP